MNLISRTSEYALRAVVWLIQEPGRSQTTRQIARGTKTPPDYASKVLQALSRAGVIRGQRGLGGGFQLVADPENLTVLDVINAVDPLECIRTCPLKLKTHRTKLCPLHGGLNEVARQMESAFRGTRILDLLNGKSTSVPLGIALKRDRKKRADALRARRAPG